MRPINSKAVHNGRNRDLGTYRDDRYVRCGRCGFVCNIDRHSRSPYGSKAGQGLTHPDPLTYDSASQFDSGSYNGRQNDFTVTGGCPFCGSYTFDQEART